MKNLFFLVDSPACEEHFLFQALNKGKDYTCSIFGVPLFSNILRRNIEYAKMALKVITQSKNKEDVIIAWLDVIGVYASFFSILLLKPRNIVSINLMFNKKRSIYSRVLCFLYQLAFNNKSFYTTINSPSLLGYYKKIFCLNEDRIFYLPDTYNYIEPFLSYDKQEDFIFCGGRNGRNWNLMFKVADRLCDIPFVFIMRRSDMPTFIPSNVKVYCDTSHSEFFSIMAKCRMLCLPLSTMAASGIIVIQAASLMEKLIITSKTPSTENYVSEGVLIESNDVEEYVSSILLYWDSPNHRNLLTEMQLSYIKRLSSSEAYIDNIFSILSSLEKTS